MLDQKEVKLFSGWLDMRLSKYDDDAFTEENLLRCCEKILQHHYEEDDVVGQTKIDEVFEAYQDVLNNPEEGPGFGANKEYLKRKFEKSAKKLAKNGKLKTPDVDSIYDLQNPLEILANGDGKRHQRIQRATEALYSNFIDQNSIYTIREDGKSEMWIYREGYYIANAKSYIYEFCRKQLGRAYNERIADNVIDKIKAETFIDKDEFFNVKPKKICVENGVLNLETYELEPHTPKEIHFQKIPVEYDAEARCPNIKNFVQSVVTEDNVDIIQEIFGFSLQRSYFLEKAFMLYGDGRNGKSKLLELLRRFLGEKNCTSQSLQTLSNNRFAEQELHNKLANIAGDISSKELKRTDVLKRLTGRDLVTADRKNKSHIKFENYAKLIFSANTLPKTPDLTHAFVDRWELIHFPYTFVTKEKLEKIPNAKEKGYKLRDPNIVENTLCKEELSGLLNWALKGLKRLQENKSFTNTKSAEQTKMTWLAQSDTFEAFCYQFLEESQDKDTFIVKEDLRETYYRYCQKNNLVSNKSHKDHTKTLQRMFGADPDYRPKVLDQQKYSYRGIKFKEEYEGLESLREGHSTPDIFKEHQNQSKKQGGEEENISTSQEFHEFLDTEGSATIQGISKTLGVKPERVTQQAQNQQHQGLTYLQNHDSIVFNDPDTAETFAKKLLRDKS